MKYSRIVSTGKYIPEKILTNEDLEKMVDTSDEWIYSRTGIKERRIATIKNYEMAIAAAKDALEGCSIAPEEIDIIIIATMTSEYVHPSVGCLVQKAIGAHKAMAFDISAACSGFLFGLSIADSYIKTGVGKNILVVGSEKVSAITNWEDRSTCVLFGDGAGAAIVTSSDEPGILEIECKSVGEQYECLVADVTRIKTPFYEQDTENYIKMEGREVFEFATTKVPDAIEKVLKDANIDKDDIGYFILHQANLRIIKRIAKKLHQDIDKFYVNMNLYGNTSSATVPVALDEMNKTGQLTGKKVVLAGFGAGLTYGACVVQF
jgi:3-oxoacyl-[acyl-carrier-protein] synthase-3